ncbi:MAG: ribosome silencing factor [Candidatus Cyclonatronum sp.]|uniref:ribosome silencing factor n=1 Tax=Cyclonatronum sp. TaxID=3024185 RepID=UPI0025C6BA29|nr:ribosome silencing factor [Cyclonatronum sp.]MCC5934959.1 ribosome silencing factor [Balneolales bacterium]MCH8487314.1 ribosome silencing factor [Cyclonatronum sp.]
MTEKSTQAAFKHEDSESLAEFIAASLSAKKAEKISIMDLRGITSLADYFVICNGLSDVHVKSLADEVSEKVRIERDDKPWRREGLETRRWVVLDFVNVVVHIFKHDMRDFYGLEKMWGDAPVRSFED